MNKVVYVGPTIIGVATRNTVYSEIPESLRTAAEAAPYLTGLCVPIATLSDAMTQIRKRNGAIYTLYKKALAYSAELKGDK